MDMRRFFMSIALLFGFYSVGFATDTDIVISTYYPSPAGSYATLKVNKLNVGQSDMHNNSDDGTIAFRPRAGHPQDTSGNYVIGSMYYNNAWKMFFYYNGDRWIASPGVAIKEYYGSLPLPNCSLGMTLVNVANSAGYLANWMNPPASGWLICD
jgi:hypothetical protein